VKKLVSIGVVLALLTMAVMPAVVGAADPIEPTTFAKIPFAIIGSGLELFAAIWTPLDTALGVGMPWVADVLAAVAPWSAYNLAWSVDMVAWGVGLVGTLMGALDVVLGPLLGESLPFALGDLKAIFDAIACGLVQPWSDNITGSEFASCP
jgi:hypothetical protein